MEERSFVKIAIVGPESSGKTTLCKQLSKALKTKWIPEYAREYLSKNPKYVQSDLDYFLKEQNKRESLAEAKILFCDGDPVSFKVWSSFKYGAVSDFIQEQVTNSDYDYYLLLAPDLPYEEDILRENRSLKNRKKLFQLFENELIQNNFNFSVVTGLEKTRLNNALEFLRKRKFI